MAHARPHRLREATLRVDSVPPEGRDIVFDAGAEEREGVATALEVTSIGSLSARLHAVRFRGGFRLTGRLEADVTQPSVVSFEPVAQHVSEPIDRVFLPGGEKPYSGAADAEVFIDPEGEDLPDHLEGGEADLTDLIVETLSLAIDPYPRLPDESIDDLGIAPDDGGDERPFAALARLKPSGDGE